MNHLSIVYFLWPYVNIFTLENADNRYPLLSAIMVNVCSNKCSGESKNETIGKNTRFKTKDLTALISLMSLQTRKYVSFKRWTDQNLSKTLKKITKEILCRCIH